MKSDVESTFIKLVENLSISETAVQLGVSAAAVSKQLKTTEERLGIQLFRRSTRSLKLTAAGQRYYQSCVLITEEKRQLQHALHDLREEPTGLISITTTQAYVRAELVPLIANFHRQYPEIQFRIHADDQNLDLISNGYDLAIRHGELRDSNLKARLLTKNPIHLCAAPSYLKTIKKIKRFEDLESLQLLLPEGLAFNNEFRQQYFPENPEILSNPFLRINDVTSLYEATLAGLGISALPQYLINGALKRNRIEKVLPKLVLPNRPLYAVMPYGRYIDKKLRLFVDFLIAHYQ